MKVALQTVLDNEAMQFKIRRIAYQIYESNLEERELILAGIKENGYKLAKRLKIFLESISDLEVVLCEVTMDKKSPLGTVATSLDAREYEGKSVVLIDDVLNTGTTLIYGVKHFLDVPLKQFKTAVLIDRNHKRYPVKADFKGISLSTSLNEAVTVTFRKGTDKAVLE